MKNSVLVPGGLDEEAEQQLLGWKWDYVMQLDDGTYIAPVEDQPTQVTNLAYLVNHNSKPNAAVIERDGDVVYKAIRNIPAKEEITLNYGEEYWTEERLGPQQNKAKRQGTCSECKKYIAQNKQRKHEKEHRLKDHTRGKIKFE